MTNEVVKEPTFKNLDPITCIVVCLFAISSWLDLNGLWVEVPIFVETLPEGWTLPSYLIISIELANIGPLIYTLVHSIRPEMVKEWQATCLIISVGIVACFLLAFFWDRTTYINGIERSTVLLTLSFFLALVDCISSVVYLPYMAQFQEVYLKALFVGEGLSGLVPALLGIAQGVGGQSMVIITVNNSLGSNRSSEDELLMDSITTSGETQIVVTPKPRFSVMVFSLLLAFLMCVSLAFFLLLNFHGYFRKFKNSGKIEFLHPINHERDEKGPVTSSEHPDLAIRNVQKRSVIITDFGRSYPNPDSVMTIETDLKIPENNFCCKNFEPIMLLVLVTWFSGISNGFIPAIQSYSCLPYGYLAYNLSVKLSVLINPVTCFFTLFFRSVQSMAFNVGVVLVSSIFAGYLTYLAFMSPDPPFKEDTIGVVLVVTASVLMTSLISYMKVNTATLLFKGGGHRSLLYCGVATQLGSLLGAVISFLLVNVFKVFVSE